MTKKTSARYSPEVRARAVRMVLEHRGDYASQWAAIGSIASKIGCTGETLRKWVRQAERDQGLRDGTTTEDGAYTMITEGYPYGPFITRNVGVATVFLPSEDEWYKAAYLKSDGSGYTTYATGDGLPVAGTDANYGGANSAPWNVGIGTIENNGTYDMGGNVYEWTESAFDGTLDELDESRALRGGLWLGDVSMLQSSSRFGDGFPLGLPDNDFGGNYVGFRVASVSAAVAAVPEPSSLGLLVIGAMGCVLRRKRG